MTDVTPYRSMDGKRKGEWSETCIGVWSKSTYLSKNKSKVAPTTICNGINLVKIKNMDIESVKPTNTFGIQIIVHDTEAPVNSRSDTSKDSSHMLQSPYENSMANVERRLAKIKQITDYVHDSLLDVANSSDKLSRFNKFVIKEYNDLRSWFSGYWK